MLAAKKGDIAGKRATLFVKLAAAGLSGCDQARRLPAPSTGLALAASDTWRGPTVAPENRCSLHDREADYLPTQAL